MDTAAKRDLTVAIGEQRRDGAAIFRVGLKNVLVQELWNVWHVVFPLCVSRQNYLWPDRPHRLIENVLS